MNPCADYQDAISAIFDGEDPGIGGGSLEAHVTRCPNCAGFRNSLEVLPRRRLEAAPQMPDLSVVVTRRHVLAERRSASILLRLLLAGVAIEMLVAAFPALVLGRDAMITTHAARHLGSFSVAFAVGLAVVVFRPARARAMLPVAVILAGGLAITAAIDLAEGHAHFFAESAHLPGLMSVVLLWLMARRPLARHDTLVASDVESPAPLRLVERDVG